MSAIAIPVPENLARLRAGQPVVFPPKPEGREETAEEKAARTISAAWLESLAEGHERVVRVPVRIENAVIEGPLDLSYARMDCEFAILDAEWADPVNFAFACLKRAATFNGSIFCQYVTFRAARAEADFEINRCSFLAASSFQDLHVGEVLDAQGASFLATDFERIEVAKHALFRSDGEGNRVRFGGEARFLGAHIGGNAEFNGAQFEKGATFDRFEVSRSAFFRSDDKGNAVRFAGKARFLGAHFGGNAEFDGAQFEKEAAFDGARIDGPAFFRPDKKGHAVRFGGEARFLGAHIEGNADFQGAQFEKEAVFDGARIDGTAFFRPDKKGHAVRFGGEASFPASAFHSEAQFQKAEFLGRANFKNARFAGGAKFDGAKFLSKDQTADFAGARFERGMWFAGAEFHHKAEFSSARSEREADFIGAQFQGPATFFESRFQLALFRKENTRGVPPGERQQFAGPVDLRGFTYDRIRVAWEEPLDKLEPYDRQPYAQMEATIRATGDDRTADDIYYARRCRENREQWKKVRGQLSQHSLPRELPAALFDWSQRRLFRYGVRPYRLLVVTILVLALGVLVFSYPGAVIPGERGSPPPPDEGLAPGQALGVSLNQFLPVGIPSGSSWKPSENAVPLPLFVKLNIAFTSYATLHHLCGWLLVPLGVGALTGLLHRRGNT